MAALFTVCNLNDVSPPRWLFVPVCLSLSSKYCQQPGVDAEQIHPWAETGEKTPFTARALEKEESITVIYS